MVHIYFRLTLPPGNCYGFDKTKAQGPHPDLICSMFGIHYSYADCHSKNS